MSSDCSVDLIFIWFAAQLYYFKIKKYLYGKLFLFGFWQMVLIWKIWQKLDIGAK